MNFGDFFAKFIGVQGVLAFLLIAAYVFAALSGIVLPEGFTEIMTLVCGFYFAKNGVGIVSAVRGK